MMNGGRYLITFGLILVALLSSVSNETRAADTVCDGSLTGKIDGNVAVPAGRACTLFQARVDGNIEVAHGATLVVQGQEEWSEITGNVEAERCGSVLLEGSVTVGGNVSIRHCTQTSGFAGPGVQLRGNFQCQNNLAACQATLGKITGNIDIDHNRSASAGNVSLNVIGGNLNCERNVPAPTHVLGGSWVKGNLQGQCTTSSGFAALPYPCAELAGLSLSDTTISAAQLYAKGAVITGAVTAPVSLCRVIGKIQPSTNPSRDSNINFEVWLPTANWTGRFEQVGNGGFSGSIKYFVDSVTPSMQSAVANESAVANTDDGSAPGGLSASFASGHPQRINDYGYRAVHRTALDAQVIVAAFYGVPPAQRYFSGCSKGGGEGLMEAQRFPEDFDGILAGDPLLSLDAFIPAAMWNTQHIASPNNPGGFIPDSSLQSITNAAQSACSNAKTISTDNFLGDPLLCRFNTQVLSSSLTLQQLHALNAVYDGPVTSANILVSPGFEPGNEAQLWPKMLTQDTLSTPPSNLQFKLADQSLTFYLQHDPATFNSLTDFNIDTTPGILDSFAIVPPSPGSVKQTVGAATDAANPDLRAFMAHGGKILHYHGWADQLIAPVNSINYYTSVVEFIERKHRDHEKALAETQDFYRLFMAPGMGHCRGGPGLNMFGQNGGSGLASGDIFTALEEWVERGTAPSQVIATDSASPPVIHRPLCPYPQTSVYLGMGNANDPGNFVCR